MTIICALLFSCGAYAAEQADASQGPVPSTDLVAPGALVVPTVASNQLLENPMLENTLPGAIQNLVKYAVSYEGVAYIRGGSSPENGFDCSGFVRYVFGRAEGVTLPHSAKALSQLGNRIKMTEIIPGDLVFFHTLRNRISHVGIYLGNNHFIHASSTRTGIVMISSLKDRYWTRRFTLARRLDTPQTTSVEASSSNQPGIDASTSSQISVEASPSSQLSLK